MRGLLFSDLVLAKLVAEKGHALMSGDSIKQLSSNTNGWLQDFKYGLDKKIDQILKQAGIIENPNDNGYSSGGYGPAGAGSGGCFLTFNGMFFWCGQQGRVRRTWSVMTRAPCCPVSR
jgi:hypothetical protein